MADWTEIGPCRLACGDCLELLPELEAGSVDAVVTDPPYFQPATHYCPTRDEGAPQRVYADLSILELFFKTFCAAAAKGTASDGSFYVFCDGQSYHMAFGALFPFTKRVRPLVWDKLVSFNGYTWRHQHELIAWGEREHTERIATGDGDIIRCRAVPVGERQHPAEKPLLLLEKILSKCGTTVLDPFMGSGTTGVACVRLGRKFIGIEMEPKYFDIACRRIENEVKNRQGRLFG